MRKHQSSAVDALVRHVVERSPFYRARFAGLIGDGPVELAALPTLDKATLMGNLDDALCDPRLRGRDLHARLLDEDPLLGEHRVMASSGSTGTPSLYVYSRADWTGLLALFFRYGELCGIRPHLPRLRVAAIGAPSLASMTQRVSQSVDIGLHRVLRLSVTDPLPRLVEALNAFAPEALNAYPSIAGLLGDEQLSGRLRISPRIVSTSSELCTAETTERIERAFGVRPFNMYATSEGLWGVDCDHHAGIHLFDDWCVVENVDRTGRPVPDGEPGERLLVTNLFNRTLPLIRFEVSDVVAIDPRRCECGRTLPRLHAVQGRLDEVIHLPGADGEPVPVHPTQFSLAPPTRRSASSRWCSAGRSSCCDSPFATAPRRAPRTGRRGQSPGDRAPSASSAPPSKPRGSRRSVAPPPASSSSSSSRRPPATPHADGLLAPQRAHELAGPVGKAAHRVSHRRQTRSQSLVTRLDRQHRVLEGCERAVGLGGRLDRLLDLAASAGRGDARGLRLERAALEAVPVGELGVRPLGATVGGLNRPEQRLLQPVGVVLVELVVRLRQGGERKPERVGRLGDGVEQLLPCLLGGVGHAIRLNSRGWRPRPPPPHRRGGAGGPGAARARHSP
jgi:phenylacetate-CoA ligase